MLLFLQINGGGLQRMLMTVTHPPNFYQFGLLKFELFGLYLCLNAVT